MKERMPSPAHKVGKTAADLQLCTGPVTVGPTLPVQAQLALQPSKNRVVWARPSESAGMVKFPLPLVVLAAAVSAARSSCPPAESVESAEPDPDTHWWYHSLSRWQ